MQTESKRVGGISVSRAVLGGQRHINQIIVGSILAIDQLVLKLEVI